MFHAPKDAYLKNIFNTLYIILINLTIPNCPEVYVVNNLCSRYIVTCSKPNPIRNYYSNQNVAPRHIQKLLTSVADAASEGFSRKKSKTPSSHNKLAVRLSQPHDKEANYGSSLGC